MPRNRNCRKCGTVHAAPTGKHCRQVAAEAEGATGATNEDIMNMLIGMETRMSAVEQAQQTQNRARDRPDEVSNDSESSVDAGEEEATQGAGENTTPDTLRQDIRAMSRAAERLAQFSMEEDLEADDLGLPRQRLQGRKSGSLMLKSDNVKQRVDWPHMHTHRMVTGRRKCVAFADLRIEEFVCGFVGMLRDPRSKLNKDLMLELLEMLMEDTIDFSWSNALGFYEKVGLDVEHGVMKWEDAERIRSMRLTYSRTVFPQKTESKEPPKPQQKATPANMRCCAAYQRQACEQLRDHPPFTHACNYCHRAVKMLCRHPEAECQRKVTDETKNVPRRE